MKVVLIASTVLVLVLGAATLLFSCIDVPRTGGPVQVADEIASASSLYTLQTKTLEGELVDLDAYQCQVALVVNVASECGLTSQYWELQALHQELSPRGFAVLAFPSNDFWGQEPGSAEEIRKLCTDKYAITFPIFEKRQVKGEEKDEVYRLLTVELEEPTWNFTKYLLDRDGKVLARFSPSTRPYDPELRAAIEDALAM